MKEKEKKTYEAPLIEEQEINDFIVLEGASKNHWDKLGGDDKLDFGGL